MSTKHPFRTRLAQLGVAAATVFALSATGAHAQPNGPAPMPSRMEHPMPPPPDNQSPLQDLHEVVASLKLSADQSARWQKAETATFSLRLAEQYQHQKRAEDLKQALSDNSKKLSAIVRQANPDADAKRMQEAQALWANFYDSLDAKQTETVRSYFLARMSRPDNRPGTGDMHPRQHEQGGAMPPAGMPAPGDNAPQ